MRILIIGGTGLISSACSELIAARGHELYILNRSVSSKYAIPQGATLLAGDIHGNPLKLESLLDGLRFDSVVDFLAFAIEDIERDLKLFKDRAGQFVFISSASAYQKPPGRYLIDENTPLENPFWDYSQDKIACEQLLMKAHRDRGFPVTIVRPSLTYGPSQIPFCVGSWAHPWTIVHRMMHGRKVIVPGDGTSLWVLTWNADFAKGLVGLLGDPRTIGEAFHITSDEVLTWDQIFLQAYRILDLEPNLIHVPSDLIAAYWPHATGSIIGDKGNSVVFDNAKVKRFVPDFKCEVSWAAGFRRAIQWHQSHPQFQTVDEEFNDMLDRLIVAQENAFPTDP